VTGLHEFMTNDTELQAGLEGAEDTSQETPAAASETPAAETPNAEQPTPNADTAPEEAATGEGEWRFNSAEWDRLHPDLATYRKQLQGDYTRAQQELRERQQAVEGIDPSSLEWVRAYNAALVTNPQAARQMLAEAQAQFDGTSAPAPVTPEIDDPWVTDTERLLAQRLERLEQEHTTANNTALVRQQMDALEKEIGVLIDANARLALYTEMTREGIPLRHARTHWLGRHGVEHIRRLAREEGAKNVVAKQEMAPAPNGLVSREVETPRQAKTHLEQLEMDEKAGLFA
jgi:hypothetical protein